MREKYKIQRLEDLEMLKRLKDTKLIKVVSGIRRCGKSTLYDLFIEHLKNTGVSNANIIKMNFESPEYAHFKDYLEIYNFIKDKLTPQEMNYIFLDGVQNIPDFQKLVDGLFILDNCDVYITGTNITLIFRELATLLSGRYIEIKMLPFSFYEYLQTQDDKANLQALYNKYVQYGSFPYIYNLTNEKDIHSYLEGIYSSVIVKDIVTRRKISDIPMLEKIIKFIFDNIGSPTSATNIANTLTSNKQKISYHTVDTYIKALLDSYIIYKTERYDIKGKQYLSTNAKYYIVDTGLRYYLLGSKIGDYGHILENIVFLELLRRNNEVYVGKISDMEIDFVCMNDGEKSYYQVAYSVLDSSQTLERELKPLKAVKDNCPKFLLTMDNIPECSYEGIKHKYIIDWLLEKWQK